MLSDPIIIAGGTMLVNVLISFGMDKTAKLRTEKDIANLYRWKDDHTKESNDVRLEFSKRLSDAEAVDKVNAAQYLEILRRLEEMRDEFKRITGKQ